MDRRHPDGRKFTDSIRTGGHLKQQGNKWGLPIVRCTYTSDSRWEKYISLIHEDIHNAINEDPTDSDLLLTLECPIIEDRAYLENATLEDARDKYDEWVWEQIRGFQDTILEGEDELYMGEEGYQTAKDTFKHWDVNEVQPARKDGKVGIPRMQIDKLMLLYPFIEPRWSFFIYADQASVDSVVNHAGENERNKSGCYYFTVVRSDLIVREHGVGTDERHFDDVNCRNFLEETRRKIKAYDFVDLVISIINDEWRYMYWTGPDGICGMF
jgi:hypothetical protein